MEYSEKHYWRSRPDPNATDAWTPEKLQPVIDFIHDETHDCKAILEFGPGVGRTFTAYTPQQQLVGFDISDSYQARVQERAADLGLNYTHTVRVTSVWDPLPFADKAFDAVVAISVLMHQRPEHIEAVMTELCRIAKKVVVITGKKGGAAHVFEHNYAGICKRKNLKLEVCNENDAQLYFVMGEK